MDTIVPVVKQSMYIYVLRPNGIVLNIEEGAFLVLADSQAAANNRVVAYLQEHPDKNAKAICQVQLKTIKETTPIRDPPKETSVSQFVSGLQLLADSYVKNDRDKKTLNRIINTLQKSYGQTV